VLRRWTIGKQVQTTPGEEGRIEGGDGHELFQHQGLGARGTELVEFFRLDDDVLLGRVLVALERWRR
jgi:hypothetical protein